MNGSNPIDIPSIFLYNSTIALLEDEFFLEVMQSLDTVYLNHEAKKAKARSKSKG